MGAILCILCVTFGVSVLCLSVVEWHQKAAWRREAAWRRKYPAAARIEDAEQRKEFAKGERRLAILEESIVQAKRQAVRLEAANRNTKREADRLVRLEEERRAAARAEEWEVWKVNQAVRQLTNAEVCCRRSCGSGCCRSRCWRYC